MHLAEADKVQSSVNTNTIEITQTSKILKILKINHC